ncbi:hypothetical protein ASPVEDRAFT_36982 [Aspergillus versicolor CBS 583.65]|uniref:Heterokaryon incompatibility domain-containing protein n=1 Tax=Aspergillus versicolor CBS 583.65 TaxID=1036611 RepID=A0A1L9P7T1_ASPVE|nr:uncharacterized protein ASPVEDRAFT_36982 [Aspergillus versicolor CBS 583.65]OJI97561.1 hypothetical protein ASPVEDRAFT_36982 [Aspergillus versicolor CBS 583.65]
MPPQFIFADTPWLGAKHDGYEATSLLEYPKLRSTDNSVQSRAALLQAQLTFGLLEAVTEVQVDESCLLRTVESDDEPGSSRQMIHSTRLPQILSHWRCRIQRLGDSDLAHQWAGRIYTAFRQARTILEFEVAEHNLLGAVGLTALDHAQVLLQIGSLAEILVSSTYVFSPKIPRQGFEWTIVLAPMLVIRKTMLSKGWCPQNISILSETVKMFAYASVSGPVIRRSSSDHASCTVQGCIRNNIPDTENYKARHVEATCRCENVAVDKVVDLLGAGKIPVIKRNPSALGELHAVDSTETKYVAISHVWADGLGSTAEKGIPSCQVDALIAKTGQIEPNGAFWLDSLCVPNERAMRKKAIGLMAQTYRNAAVVLVLDSTIRSTSVTAARELKLLRTLSSGWMQRLWTLQEAVLAGNVVFAFADGLVPLSELIPTGQELFNGVASDLASELFRLQKYRTRAMNLSDLSTALRWRMTSKPHDELLAVSGLLNVDAGGLGSLSAPKRMPSFLLQLRELPKDIIFLSGPKSEQPKFQWAPATFMRAVESRLNFGSGTATCTDTGLLAEYKAFYFSDSVINEGHPFIIQGPADHETYRAMDAPSRKDPSHTAVPVSYRCNAILLPDLRVANGVTPCVAIWGDPAASSSSEREENRIACEFRKRILLQYITPADLEREKITARVVPARSGRMRVRLF